MFETLAPIFTGEGTPCNGTVTIAPIIVRGASSVVPLRPHPITEDLEVRK
jgi:hypothetical protein